MKNVIDLLQSRGFIDQMSSDELGAHLSAPRGVYVGFDPTADSLHLGNLMGIVALCWFQRCGHMPYVVLGGATGRIGDPSGKSVERPFLSSEELHNHVEALTFFVGRIMPQAVILNNDEWLGQISMIHFLRDIGKHFRVGVMLGKEMVRARLASEEGISFTEFSYQILQAYDFVYLNKTHEITLQMGGSDQWGNMTAGIELARKLSSTQLFALTFPLITRSDGKKFGKSEQGAVWLSAEKLSPYLFYQYLMQIPDADVIRLMRLLTFLDLEEIEVWQERMREPTYQPNSAQKKLAEEITRFVHGEAGLETARRVTEGANPGSKAQLSAQAFEEIAADMPSSLLSSAELIGEKFSAVCVKTGLVTSKSEAVRLIKNGGAYMNNIRVDDPEMRIQREDFIEGKFILLSAGKKKKHLIRIS